MSMFDQTRIAAAKVDDPYRYATSSKPRMGTLEIHRVFFQADPGDLATWEDAGFTLLPEGYKSLKGLVGDARNGAFVLPSGTGSVFLKFEGDFTPAPSNGSEYSSQRMETMFPLVGKPEQKPDGWIAWVSGAEKSSACIFDALGHPLRPNADLQRLMPALTPSDAAGVGFVMEDLKAVFEDIAAAVSQGPIVVHCGTYRRTNREGRIEYPVVSVGE